MPLICVVITFLAPNIQFATQAKKSQENANIEVCGHIALVVPMRPHATARLRMHHPQTLDTFSSPHKTSETKRNEEKKHQINIGNTLAVSNITFMQDSQRVGLPNPFNQDCMTFFWVCIYKSSKPNLFFPSANPHF